MGGTGRSGNQGFEGKGSNEAKEDKVGTDLCSLVESLTRGRTRK